MIMGKVANTNFTSWEAKEIFLKEEFFFRFRIFLFGPKWLESVLCVVLIRELVRLKADDLNLLLCTHLMVLRPLENFLRAFEAVRGENLGSQK